MSGTGPTPAGAGNAVADCVHSSWLTGSTPACAGNILGVLHGPGVLRPTPACAGSTHCLAHLRPSSVAHPRLCGEYSTEQSQCGCQIGSPPRVRGILLVSDGSGVDRGITPACAGNTAHEGNFFHGHRDHPRVCGETRPWCRALRRSRDHPRVCGEYRT